MIGLWFKVGIFSTIIAIIEHGSILRAILIFLNVNSAVLVDGKALVFLERKVEAFLTGLAFFY